MKLLFGLALVLFLSAVAFKVQAGKMDDIPPEVFKIVAACKVESGASDEDMAALMKHQPAATMEGKCVKFCIFQKMSLMSGDGKISKDIAIKVMEAYLKGDAAKLKAAEEILDVCKDIPVSSNHCEAAEQYAACLVIESGKRGFSPDQL